MTHPYGRNADEVEEKQPPLCAKGRDLLCHANNLSFPAAQSVQSGAPNWLATKSVDSCLMLDIFVKIRDPSWLKEAPLTLRQSTGGARVLANPLPQAGGGKCWFESASQFLTAFTQRKGLRDSYIVGKGGRRGPSILILERIDHLHLAITLAVVKIFRY
jgi:hypothetical protein